MIFLDALLRFTRRFFRGYVRLLRLGVYLIAVFLLFSFLAARALYAQVKEAAAALGREIAELPELTREAEALSINGARMHYARATTKESVAEVLDRLEAHCQKHLGPLGEALNEIGARHPEHMARYAPKKGFRSAVMRHDDAEGGVVLCFTDDRATPLSDVPAVLTRFAETSDLSELGHLRYAYAQRASSTETLVVTMWTDSELNLSKMFPASGDAQGVDSAVVPRPPESRRTLSAAAEGMPLGVRIYESRQKLADVEGFYKRWFEKNDWRLGAKATEPRGSTYFSPEGYQVIVAFSEEDGKSFATVLEAGRSDGPPIATVEVSE